MFVEYYTIKGNMYNNITVLLVLKITMFIKNRVV